MALVNILKFKSIYANCHGICMHVRVCMGVRVRATHAVRICMGVGVRVCMDVRVCVCAGTVC